MKKLIIYLLLMLFLINSVSASLTDGIVSYWKFDNNDLTDSLFKLNGTNTGTTNIPGKINDARYLDGTDMINFTQKSPTASVLFSFWFTTNSTTCSGDGCVIYFWGNLDTTVAEYIMVLGTEISYVFGAAGGSNNVYRTSGAGIAANQYYHVVINGTGNGGVGRYQIYINGTNQTLTFGGAGANRARPAGSYVFYMGLGHVSFVKLQGRIDEFGIWNRTVTGTEVSNLYNNYNGLSYPFVLGTCTCPSLNQNWNISMADYCNITTTCNLGTGKMSFYGSGYCSVNATVNTTSLGDPGTNGLLKILSNALIWVRG